nr:hypothetical protein [Tanacetum cinerariifolium]
MSSFYEFICYGCEGPSDTPVCYLFTCEQCGNILVQGTCLKCNSGTGISFTYDPIPEYFNEVQINPNPPPQSHFNIFSCQICESNSHYGYECSQRVPFVYVPEPCYTQNFSDSDYSHDLPGVNPLIDHYCCYKCGNSLNDFICHQCTCEFCGNDAHVGYNCPAQVPSIQTRPSFYNNILVVKIVGIFLKLTNLMEQLTSMCDMVGQYIQRKEEEKRIEEEQAAKAQNWKLLVCYDDDDDEERSISLKDNIISGLPPCAAITPSLSTEEPDNSLSMGDEHLDTVLAAKSDEFIKSSVESLVPIPSESEGIPKNICDVPFHDNSSPLDVSKDQFEDFFDSNNESTSTDDDSFSIDNIEYVEASPLDSELVSSEVMEIVIPEVGGIDDDILLTIKDDILRERLMNINLLIANIEALKDNPTLSSDFMTKLVVAVPLLALISLPDYEAVYDDHIKEISSGSTTTHSDSSLYDSFIFDLSINPCPPADRSDFHEFADELSHIISLPEYDCFHFKIEPNSGDLTMDVVEDNFPTREPRVYNALPIHPTFQLNLNFILSSESLFAYVVWIFLFFLSYSVAPQYLLSLGNEDTIFDPGICNYHIFSFLLDVFHRCGTFIKFKVLNESSMEILFSTCSPMDQ